jgi:hypothetical protein
MVGEPDDQIQVTYKVYITDEPRILSKLSVTYANVPSLTKQEDSIDVLLTRLEEEVNLVFDKKEAKKIIDYGKHGDEDTYELPFDHPVLEGGEIIAYLKLQARPKSDETYGDGKVEFNLEKFVEGSQVGVLCKATYKHKDVYIRGKGRDLHAKASFMEKVRDILIDHYTVK